uniref:Uncharacterized protein n=1 Tax=Arundo donax TaxID=35708 RepID=A0A0A8YMX6_ARUDO
MVFNVDKPEYLVSFGGINEVNVTRI